MQPEGGEQMSKIKKQVSIAKNIKNLLGKPSANIIAIVLLFIGFWLVCNPNTFLTFSNFMNIIEQCTILAIIALGSYVVIVLGGIDLSLGATMSFSGVVTAQLVSSFGWGMIPAALIGIVAGILIGVLSGLIISRNNVAPFIITLGAMNISRSLALILSEAKTVSANIPSFRFIGGSYLFGFLPYSVFIVIIIYLIFYIITKKTRYGTYIYAVGGNEMSAALSGISVRRIKLITYMLSSMLAAIAGILLASRLGSASPGGGEGYEFYGIAAAVVGGASMAGGKGTALKTLSGAFIISILRNGLNMSGLEVSLQMVALGVVIIGVVTIDTLGIGKRRKKYE